LRDQAFEALSKFLEEREKKDAKRNAERTNRAIREIISSFEDLEKLVGDILVKALRTELDTTKKDLKKAEAKAMTKMEDFKAQMDKKAEEIVEEWKKEQE
jgi:Na+/phosphate symporter